MRRRRFLAGAAVFPLGACSLAPATVQPTLYDFGLEPLPHLELETYLRRHEELQDLERELYRDDPFTWSDAWHFYLQKVRPQR